MKKSTIGVVLIAVFILFAISYENLTELDRVGSALFLGNGVLKWFHLLGNTSVVIGITIIMLVWQLVGRNWWGAALVFGSVCGAAIINQLIKRVFERPRPEMVNQLESFSFPSAHSMLSVAYIVVLVYLLLEKVSKRAIQRVLIVLSSAFMVCVGLARVAQNHHYLTDVLAGWSLAGAWLALCLLIYEKQKSKVR